MMSRTLTLFAVLALVVLVPGVRASVLYFDFGDSSQITPGNYNNLIVNPPGNLTILNAIDSTGAGTGIGVTVTGFFNGSNTQGTTTPSGAAAVFDPQATRDNGFGHAAAFGGNPLTPMGTIEITGLDPALPYDFTFFASRLGATDNRETEYAVMGSNAGSAFLDASGNTSLVADVLSITPTALGQIIVQVDPGPNNNNASQFWYIAAMRISVVPEPASVIAGGLLVITAGLRPRRSLLGA